MKRTETRNPNSMNLDRFVLRKNEGERKSPSENGVRQGESVYRFFCSNGISGA